jgi:hypothetical protein
VTALARTDAEYVMIGTDRDRGGRGEGGDGKEDGCGREAHVWQEVGASKRLEGGGGWRWRRLEMRKRGMRLMVGKRGGEVDVSSTSYTLPSARAR